MKNPRRKFTSEFKTRIVLEAIAEPANVSDIAKKFDLNRTQINDWKKKFISHAHIVFDLDHDSLKNSPAHGDSKKSIPLTTNH